MSTEEKAKLSMVNQDSLSEIQQNDALQIENEDVYEKLTFVVDKGQEPMRIDKWVQMRIDCEWESDKKQLPYPSGRRSGLYELCQPGLHRIETRGNGLGYCV